MKIEVEVRNVYGVAKVYPANAAGHMAAELVGAKTFNARQLNLLRFLGHEVVEVNPNKLEL